MLNYCAFAVYLTDTKIICLNDHVQFNTQLQNIAFNFLLL